MLPKDNTWKVFIWDTYLGEFLYPSWIKTRDISLSKK